MSKGSVNKVILIGRLGADAEVKTIPSGSTVANFRVATNYSVKSGEEWTDQTEWSSVVAWNRLADVMQKYTKKGSRIYVEGRLQTRSWEQDGQKRYATEVVAGDIQLLGSKSESLLGNTNPNDVPTGDASPDEFPF